MLTIKDIEAAGGQVVAGKVVKGGKFIEGIWAEGTFAPADENALAAPAPAPKAAPRYKGADVSEGVIK
jgi:hypothetical protein